MCVKTDTENIVLANQNVSNVTDLIRNNFMIVKNHYEKLACKGGELIDIADVYYLSLSIVLHYLYVYNSWRAMYKKQENKNLNFNEKDFNDVSCHDIIFYYFKSKYPQNWKMKSAILLGIGLDELEIYYKRREEYYNK